MTRYVIALMILAVLAGCEKPPNSTDADSARAEAAQQEAQRAKKERDFLTPSGNSQSRTITNGRLSDSK